MHGLLVWSLTLFFTLPWLALGTALVAGRTVKHHAESLRTSSRALRSAAGAEPDALHGIPMASVRP
jgi:hypothetical protein